jgi:hypothetical protein
MQMHQWALFNNIQFQDNEEINLITTIAISDLRVFDLNGYEIKSEACSISGMDDDQFDIYLEAISYPFYNHEFKHHVIAYERSLSS